MTEGCYWPFKNLPTVAQAGDITATDIETSYRQTDFSADLPKKIELKFGSHLQGKSRDLSSDDLLRLVTYRESLVAVFLSNLKGSEQIISSVTNKSTLCGLAPRSSFLCAQDGPREGRASSVNIFRVSHVI